MDKPCDNTTAKRMNGQSKVEERRRERQSKSISFSFAFIIYVCIKMYGINADIMSVQ